MKYRIVLDGNIPVTPVLEGEVPAPGSTWADPDTGFSYLVRSSTELHDNGRPHGFLTVFVVRNASEVRKTQESELSSTIRRELALDQPPPEPGPEAAQLRRELAL